MVWLREESALPSRSEATPNCLSWHHPLESNQKSKGPWVLGQQLLLNVYFWHYFWNHNFTAAPTSRLKSPGLEIMAVFTSITIHLWLSSPMLFASHQHRGDCWHSDVIRSGSWEQGWCLKTRVAESNQHLLPDGDLQYQQSCLPLKALLTQI